MTKEIALELEELSNLDCVTYGIVVKLNFCGKVIEMYARIRVQGLTKQRNVELFPLISELLW